MSRVMLILAVTLAILTGLSRPADAALAGWNWSLSTVASTSIDTPRGHRLMLCKLSPTWRLAGLPLWVRRPDYVLASQCHGSERLAAITPERVAAAQSAGLIPARVSPEPMRNAAELLASLWGWAFFALMGVGLALMQRTRRRVARYASLEI